MEEQPQVVDDFLIDPNQDSLKNMPEPSLTRSSSDDEASLAQTRMNNEAKYFQRLQQGGRVKKNAAQLDALISHFQENPYWDYATKLRIAENLKMTYA